MMGDYLAKRIKTSSLYIKMHVSRYKQETEEKILKVLYHMWDKMIQRCQGCTENNEEKNMWIFKGGTVNKLLNMSSFRCYNETRSCIISLH